MHQLLMKLVLSCICIGRVILCTLPIILPEGSSIFIIRPPLGSMGLTDLHLHEMNIFLLPTVQRHFLAAAGVGATLCVGGWGHR
ncbi:unnamed protein product [Ixodes persulcatus]